ncbi:efflux RND transporter periplasmic adaptor subunit [Chitinispirillales bacterium ANBcel5]|uniref:efflux RND transporter periplasmic adaptor subunit n=1 Tax=Cellulosispirillum alkaliphilum TaxID=3039283 RepID=UPI002A4F7925|nr:efflux RND transporter periplasmic adaptor subunit [Chitinispirillales bacterium ANBcel5]
MNRKCIVVTVLSLIFIVSCGGDNESSGRRRLREYYTAGAVDLEDRISQTGLVQPVVQVDLKSEASGRIERVLVQEGQKVSAGDTILVIDPSRLHTQREKLQLGLRRSRLEKQIADRDFENGKRLLETGSVSRRRLDDLEIARDLASISFQQQQLELRDIEDQLKETVVRSPMDGVITSLFVKEGEIAVSATSGLQSGTPIATISDISKLEVITSVGEVDYIHIEKGQNVIIRPEAIEGTSTNGTVQFISLSAKRDNSSELGSFEIRASVDSLIPGIAPGINVNVEFVVLQKSAQVAVPYHYVSVEDGKNFVHIAKAGPDGDETVEKVSVEIGATDYKYYQILSGLNEGDKVVYMPPRPGR